MSNEQYLNYMKSISAQLDALKNRFRHLVGQHWPTDGSYKEVLLRSVISKSIPKKIGVCQGFMVNEGGQASTQIDIMLIDEFNKPTLFREGDLVVVTPDSVLGIIEVKTKIRSKDDLRESLEKIAQNKARHFDTTNRHCKAGLFCYEDVSISDQDILKTLHDVGSGGEHRTINYASFGADRFFRFWHQGEPPYRTLGGESFWHSYEIKDVAQAYFLSNLIWDLSELGRNPFEYSPEKVWFPIQGGKENNRTGYIGLRDSNARLPDGV